MTDCEIMQCSCKNEYQDKEYGKGNRVFNPTTKGHRCTNCLRSTGETKKDKKNA